MNEDASAVFYPIRQQGLILHAAATLLLLGGSGSLFWLAVQQRVGAYFVLFILVAILLLFPLPLIVYRGYALLNASYTLERDGLRLRWGLRAEDIPLPNVEWVQPVSELPFALPLPRLNWPGAVLGTCIVPNLGTVEFLASDADHLYLVATAQRIYAISPADPAAFAHAFQRTAEMGSLSPLQAHSALPAAFLQMVWADRIARILLLVGLGLTLALFITVSLIIPTRSTISLGFQPNGQPLADPGPAAALLLLPVLAALTYAANLIAGLFFYRHPEEQIVAYMLWVSSATTPLLLFIATWFLITQ